MCPKSRLKIQLSFATVATSHHFTMISYSCLCMSLDAHSDEGYEYVNLSVSRVVCVQCVCVCVVCVGMSSKRKRTPQENNSVAKMTLTLAQRSTNGG